MKYSMVTYGFNAVKLYKNYSIEQLANLLQEILLHPDNKNPDEGSIWLTTKQARKESDAVAYAIYYHQQGCVKK